MAPTIECGIQMSSLMDIRPQKGSAGEDPDGLKPVKKGRKSPGRAGIRGLVIIGNPTY